MLKLRLKLILHDIFWKNILSKMLTNEDGNLIATAVCRVYNKFFS